MLNINKNILQIYFFLQNEISIIFDPIAFEAEDMENQIYVVPYGTPIPKNMHQIFPNPTSPKTKLDTYIHIGLFKNIDNIPKNLQNAYILPWEEKIAVLNIDIVETEENIFLIQEITNEIYNIIEDFTDNLLPAPQLNTNSSLKNKERDKWQLKLQELKKVKDLYGK